jgi:hypothetical protein
VSKKTGSNSGYRQTIGAKKERVRSANDEVEKILVRRIVLEDYTPSVREIGRLIDGKARDFRVRPSDLLSEGQLLNNIFTRIIETDFIPREQREQVLQRLSAIVSEAEEQPVFEEALEQIPSRAQSRRVATIAMGMMGMAASIVGGLLAALPDIRGVDVTAIELLPAVARTALASLAIIGFIIILCKIRERQQEEPSKASLLSDYIDFERQVLETFKKAGLLATIATCENRSYDFIFEINCQKYLM